jgi:4-amino-4-deoxy-L-arabinose transferase-like glycosyltransferase
VTLSVTLLALGGVIRLGILLNTALDPDESQHLHAAWRVGQGQIPFVDFWEHHAPLLYPLLVPLTWGLPDSPGVYLAGRALMTAWAVLAFALTWRLGRRLGRESAWLAVAVLALLPRFAEKTTEIRPDVPALVAWLLALLALVRWREEGRPGWLWAAGLAQGVGIGLTLKALYGLAGLLTAAALGAARGPGRAGARVAAGAAARLGAGASLPLVALAGVFWGVAGTRGLESLWAHLVVANARFVDFAKIGPGRPEETGALLLAVLGLGLAQAGRLGASAWRPVHLTLAVPLGIVSAILMLPWTPAVYEQAWLPTLPVVALYAGWGLDRLVRGGSAAPRWVRALVVATVLGLPAALSTFEAVRDRQDEQLRVMRLLLRTACPDEPVLDGSALAVFRPTAQRYGVLMTGLRYWIAQGRIAEEEIESDLRQARARVAYPDNRLRALVGPVAWFLARHYVRTEEGLLVAGAETRVDGRPEGGRAYLDLLVAGTYRLQPDPGIAVAIDRTPRRPGWVDLAAGRHELTWTGPAGRIRLVAAGCVERRARQGALAGGGAIRLTLAAPEV